MLRFFLIARKEKLWLFNASNWLSERFKLQNVAAKTRGGSIWGPVGAEAPTEFFLYFSFIINLSLFYNLPSLKIDYPHLRLHLYFTLFNFTNCPTLKADSLDEKKGERRASDQKKKRERKEQKKWWDSKSNCLIRYY